MSRGDQRDRLDGADVGRRRQDAQRLHVATEALGLPLGELAPVLSVAVRPLEQRVVDVGDVLDVGDLVAGVAQHALQHVVGQVGGRVAEVGGVVGRDAADVHRRGGAGRERPDLVAGGVVDPQRQAGPRQPGHVGSRPRTHTRTVPARCPRTAPSRRRTGRAPVRDRRRRERQQMRTFGSAQEWLDAQGETLGSSDWLEITQEQVEQVRRRHGRPPVDPRRRRTREEGEPLRRPDRARLPHALAGASAVLAGVQQRGRQDGRELRLQQGALPGARAGGVEGALDARAQRGDRWSARPCRRS